MPAGDPRPPKRSWREGAASTPKSAAGKRAWKQEASAGESGPLFTRRGKILLAAGGLLGVLGAIIAVYLWMRPIDPPRLVLIGAGYETNLAVPHNVQGRRALTELADWAREHNKNWAGDKDKGIDPTPSSRRSTVAPPPPSSFTSPSTAARILRVRSCCRATPTSRTPTPSTASTKSSPPSANCRKRRRNC